MAKIFFIGHSTLKNDYKDVFVSNGQIFETFQSISAAIPKLDEKADLLIIDIAQSTDPSFKEFLKQSIHIPKIIITHTQSFRGMVTLLKQPLTYLLYTPGVKELWYFAKRLLREKELINEYNQLKDSLSVVKRELDFYKDLNRTLTSSLELNNVLVTIMKKAKEITNAEAWSVLLVDQNTGEMVFKKTEDKKKTKEIQRLRMRIGEGICGWVAQSGIPVVVLDVVKDKHYCEKIDKAIHFKTKSIICVPIKSRGQIIGVLEVMDKTTGQPFTEEDLSALMKLIDQAAIAIEIASLYQRMADLVITDDLTKLFNTRYLNRTIEMEIQRSVRYHSSVSLIFMDIDYFKNINDRYGHLVGSKVLVEMGQLLLKNLRTVDIVTRYGGDEFVIVLPQTPPSAATQIAERIRISIEKNVFMKKEGYSLKMTASFGVTSYPESAKSKEELIKLADEAMYKIKYQRGNGVYAIV
jgi:diguanylate cyclase (GGDEF)-like protein